MLCKVLGRVIQLIEGDTVGSCELILWHRDTTSLGRAVKVMLVCHGGEANGSQQWREEVNSEVEILIEWLHQMRLKSLAKGDSDGTFEGE